MVAGRFHQALQIVPVAVCASRMPSTGADPVADWTPSLHPASMFHLLNHGSTVLSETEATHACATDRAMKENIVDRWGVWEGSSKYTIEIV